MRQLEVSTFHPYPKQKQVLAINGTYGLVDRVVENVYHPFTASVFPPFLRDIYINGRIETFHPLRFPVFKVFSTIVTRVYIQL
jgi:hypothetical protein